MKILITHPNFKNPGGVANFFLVLDRYFKVEVTHFDIGERLEEKNPVLKCWRIFKDYFLFLKAVKGKKYDVVHINPSLNFKSIVRDGILILLSKYSKVKTLVFFHGWDKDFEKTLHKIPWLFHAIYNQSNIFIVLAIEFKNKLLEWKINQPIYLETPAVDDKFVKDLNMQRIVEKKTDSRMFRVIFLSRIEKEKGIYETIDAIQVLSSKYFNIELVVTGGGSELQKAKEYVKIRNIPRITFTGYIKEEFKKNLFEESHVYCLPTYYGEGMPASVLEAMAFGLPVITRPVGGIADFFEQGKHGFITESKSPSDIAAYIEKLYSDKELYRNISLYNYQYAKERFWASKVTERLEKIYESVLHLQ